MIRLIVWVLLGCLIVGVLTTAVFPSNVAGVTHDIGIGYHRIISWVEHNIAGKRVPPIRA